MARKSAQKVTPPADEVKAAPAPKPAKVELPEIGDTVLYRVSADELRPMMVTALVDAVVPEDPKAPDAVTLPAGFSGQVFLHGTQTQFVERASFGDDVGQCVKR